MVAEAEPSASRATGRSLRRPPRPRPGATTSPPRSCTVDAGRERGADAGADAGPGPRRSIPRPAAFSRAHYRYCSMTRRCCCLLGSWSGSCATMRSTASLCTGICHLKYHINRLTFLFIFYFHFQMFLVTFFFFY